jgi:hypothetical protein
VWKSRKRGWLYAAFLLPVLLLHGSWAAKQAWIQGEFLWATSSWGGFNIQSGDMKRYFAQAARKDAPKPETGIALDALTDRVECLQRWRHIKSMGFFVEQQLMAPQPADAGPSAKAIEVDNASLAARGVKLSGDTAIAREYSQCLQRAYLSFWQHNPGHLLKSWWQSYGIFWAAIRDFAEVYPMTLIPEHKRWDDPAKPPAWQPAGNLLSNRYRLRQDRYPDFFPTSNAESALRPVTLITLPLLPQVLSLLAMITLHLAPVLYALLWLRNKNSFSRSDSAVLFMYITYGYLAVISNIGEHGENMRFRLVVEPLVWCMALAVVVPFARSLRYAGADKR